MGSSTMGSGAKTPHQNYELSPSVDPIGLSPETGPLELPEEAIAELNMAKALIGSMVEDTNYDADDYEALVKDVNEAKSHLAHASELGATQLTEDEWAKLKEFSKNYAESLTPEQLQQLATAQGFDHAGLVGIGMDSGVGHPLAFWVNPYYDAEEQKAKVQQKALDQYAQLQQAGQVTGKDGTVITAADYAAASGATPPVKFIHTPEEIQDLLARREELKQTIKAYSGYPHYNDPDKLALVRAAKLELLENSIILENTQCTDKGYAIVLPDESYSHQLRLSITDLEALHEEFKDKYGLELMDLGLLFNKGGGYSQYSDEFKGYLAEEMQGNKEGPFHKGIVEKKAKFEEFKENAQPALNATYVGNWNLISMDIGSLATAEGKQAAYDFFAKTAVAQGQVVEIGMNDLLRKHGLGLEDEVGNYSNNHKMAVLNSGYSKDIPKGLRAWAKDQKIADLRELAQQLNPEMSAGDIKALKRAQLQNLIIGHIHGDTKHKYENPPVIYKSYSYNSDSNNLPGAAPANKGKVVAGIMMPAKPVNFSQKYTDNMQALLAMGAAHAGVQDRPSQAEVSQMEFQPTSAAVSGGAHSKSFYKDSKGRTWMFKPDNTNNGARADAEAAASEVMHKIGLPSVPVRTAKLEGKKGAIQPIIPKTTNLSPSPASWSQADLDGIVRMHVGSWLVGDHDGNNTNVLKTEGGGIVPIDQGQAFKFIGRDRLAVDYHPNSSFGSVPVYHTAYMAAMSGSLATDVHVRPSAAVPVIDKIESMPDEAFRDILRSTAEEGAKHKVEWYGPMEKKAKKIYGTSSPTTQQVADTFLDTAVERKKNIRKDFSEFFAGLGFSEAETSSMAEVG